MVAGVLVGEDVFVGVAVGATVVTVVGSGVVSCVISGVTSCVSFGFGVAVSSISGGCYPALGSVVGVKVTSGTTALSAQPPSY